MPIAAEMRTGRKRSQIARGPAPSDLDAAAASAKAPTTKRHVTIESSAKPPRLYTPYMKTCASHCWSVHVAPRP